MRCECGAALFVASRCQALFVAPVVEDVAQDVRVATWRKGFEETSSRDAAPIGDTALVSSACAVDTAAGRSNRTPEMRVALENCYEEVAFAPANIDDRAQL
jgi:hypothetical protein